MKEKKDCDKCEKQAPEYQYCIDCLEKQLDAALVANNRLQAIYDREANIRITSFFDAGIAAEIGDDVNGGWAYKTFDTFKEAIDWLEEKTRR